MISRALTALQQERKKTQAELDRLQAQAARLDAALSALQGGGATAGKTRRVSAATRAKMAAAQQVRWSKRKGQSKAVASKPKQKRTMSAAARKKISESRKQWWADRKKQQR